jgi:hypothetical protein
MIPGIIAQRRHEVAATPPFAQKGPSDTATGTTGSLNLAPYAVGDLIIVCALSSSGSLNVPAGWTNAGISNSTRRCYKILEAGDLATLSMTFSASGNHAVMSIVVSAGTFDPAVAPVQRARLAGLDPESPSTTPLVSAKTEDASFADRHNLVVAYLSWKSNTATVAGYAYANTTGNLAATSGSPRARLASCSQPFYGQESPEGQFSMSASVGWSTFAFSIAGVAP